MAPLPPSNTRRYKLRYATTPFNHSITMRTGPTVTLAAAITKMDGFLSSLSTLLGTITVLGFDFADVGSNIYFPQTWTGPATYGATTPANIQEPAFISYVGKTPTGRRVRVTVFGITGVTQQDYRYQPGESSLADAGRAVLVAGADTFLGIDGLKPIWNNYANLGFNSYWQRQLRG